MCGICGIFNRNNNRVNMEDLKRMSDIQAHRGPDDSGYYSDSSIGMGHKRLSIIDLSPSGHQPMSNEDGSLWVVYNGEIYNYVELRRQLEQLGHSFKSSSDTEVILHSYEQWGTMCVAKFNGMWAFGLWDTNKKKLFLSRDRFGVKPLYYYMNDQTIIFASEIKSVLSIKADLRVPNYPYLIYFMRTGLHDDGSETFFKDIKSLEGSHCLEVSLDGSRLWQYWDYDPVKTKERYDYSDAIKTFLELLTDSVRLRLRSDVPVGTCLSGGLDSSTIVALTTKLKESSVCTFTVTYDDPDCYEENYAREVVSMYGTKAFFARPDETNFFARLPEIIWHMDEPNGSPGLISQRHVMDIASKEVKVLLDGQGGDELLGGYYGYFAHYLEDICHRFTETLNPEYLVRLFREREEIREMTGTNYYPWKRIVKDLPFVNHALKIKRSRVRPTRPIRAPFGDIIDTHLSQRSTPLSRITNRKFESVLQDALYWSLTKQSLPALLHYEDRNSMAFSIEARVPYLDYRLVEFCIGLPASMKIRGSVTKYILRKASKDLIPKSIILRKDKKGYTTPCGRWFREQMDALENILFSSNCARRSIFNMDEIGKRLEAHRRRNHDYSWEIFRWLTTEVWFREFIDDFIPFGRGSLDG